MTRLSSNWTLFHKFFIPTFWIVLLGACVVATWIMDISTFASMRPTTFGIILTTIYLLGILYFYSFTLRLKRVEIDEQYIYITNYFKNYRYPHEDIDYVEERLRPLFSRSTVHLKGSGSLGNKITYIPVKTWLQDFLREHPSVYIEIKSSKNK